MNWIKNLIVFKIKPVLAIWIFLGFVAFTVIGTLTHELGHIAMAKALGYNTTFHYGSMNYDSKEIPKDIKEIAQRNKNAISKGENFPGKDRWEEVRNDRIKDRFLISLGGPLQTMVTGTIGLFFLYRRKDSIKKTGLKFADWILIFLSLFWLRELSNLMMGVIRSILHGHFNPFLGRSDEIRLARHLDIWEGSVSLPLAIVALAVGLYVIFRIIPKSLRFTFILAGFFGGLFGFWFWLMWLGPIVMP